MALAPVPQPVQMALFFWLVKVRKFASVVAGFQIVQVLYLTFLQRGLKPEVALLTDLVDGVQCVL